MKTWLKRLAALGASTMVLSALLAPTTHADELLNTEIAHANGGGAGTFNLDLDADGDIDGSQFGFDVNFYPGGQTSGHFECLMAGRSDFLGLKIMAVEGTPEFGVADPVTGVAKFNGSGTLHIDGSKEAIKFFVEVKEGKAGEGKLHLTVVRLDPTAQPQVVTFPPEDVASGQIVVH